MTLSVRRLRPAERPSLFREAASAPDRPGPTMRWVLILLAAIAALVIAVPGVAQVVPAPPAPAAPGVGDAVDRALDDLGGGKAPLALSL
ncbi:MAG: flagellar biosynthetic protein FliP, partial [Zymomonas sp.]|nr:flagellar biosynthetic protein FliP [Zymomonas sp.]